ncbi:MAG: PH domain-containing protein [Lachnospiraceae bacterium]|nr:PH domain-containing protein [Lachnospiraceae bacterium]
MDKIWSSRKRWVFFGLPFTFTEYTLTKEKLLVDSGFLNKKEEEVRLYRVLDLSLTRSLAQRIFGLGTIICKTSDKSLPILEIVNIRNSKEIKEQLSALVEEERVNKRVSMREFSGANDFDDMDDNNDDTSENL